MPINNDTNFTLGRGREINLNERQVGGSGG
jgi:hypothetical protein